MADYLNDIKADVIQTRLLIGGSSVPQEHRYTPLDGDVAICMNGDDTMEYGSIDDALKYKKQLANAGKDLVDTDTIKYSVDTVDKNHVPCDSSGKPILINQIVIGKNLLSDNPTWQPIATLDQLPEIHITADVKVSTPDTYIYHVENGHSVISDCSYITSWDRAEPEVHSLIYRSYYDATIDPVQQDEVYEYLYESKIVWPTVIYTYYEDWPGDVPPPPIVSTWVDFFVSDVVHNEYFYSDYRYYHPGIEPKTPTEDQQS